jgi:hypothetical protein
MRRVSEEQVKEMKRSETIANLSNVQVFRSAQSSTAAIANGQTN